MGKFIEPSKHKIEHEKSAVVCSVKFLRKAIIAKYIKSSNNSLTKRASQAHQVPQLLAPHSEPQIRVRAVKFAPIGAITFRAAAQIKLFAIKTPNAHIAIQA